MSEKNNQQKKKGIGGFLQFLKFAMFSASAGIIEIASFTLMNTVLIKLPFIQNALQSNETFARIMNNEYGPMYLIALVLSVLWNFTFNRKFTFKSASNVPVAMLKVFAFYCVFTPVTVIAGNYFTAEFADVKGIEYIVLGCTMACNMITEFLYDKFVVFRDALDKKKK
ncbi:GtrA family protein [uncultured Eubacterium sp.]|uniref:GtrA family protein n=1 Tax=uncultured Eubacterium sp. TaxID=165185 RepID=UPI0015B01182|nr:GtrA family protein [uncultured Eubacterium sp.]